MQVNLESIDDHGWHADGNINWITEPYPEDINDLLLEESEDLCSDIESDKSDFYESDVESDDDNDFL